MINIQCAMKIALTLDQKQLKTNRVHYMVGYMKKSLPYHGNQRCF